MVRVLMSRAPAYRQILITVGKASISLAAMAIVISQIKLNSLPANMYKLNIWVILGTLVVLMTETSVIAGLRLALVLDGLGVKRSLTSTSQVALGGFFFEQVAFGFVGGDGMRLWLLHRIGVAPRKSVQAIVVDRCLGLLALLLLALIG